MCVITYKLNTEVYASIVFAYLTYDLQQSVVTKGSHFHCYVLRVLTNSHDSPFVMQSPFG